ncbi:hypothetical protein EV127DRAFT_432274 [Xylaria flabelliformis]|nr:hypothetical protein EV127DRAFT_432274 [Xylaria flabelliformis]
MLLRRLWTRASHTTRTASSQSRSTASLPTHSRAQIPYKDARLQFHNYGKQQHSSKAYSNFAPRGPSQHHGAYSQPPNSRAKDVAIGSALTIAAYIAYLFYYSRQLAEEDMVKFAKEVNEICSRYEKLLRKAEMDDDGSPESAKEIDRILQERMLDLLNVERPNKSDTIVIESVGSLPRFPEGHEQHGSEMVTGEDHYSSVYMLPPISKEELATLGPEDTEKVIFRSVIITINDTMKNLGIDSLDSESPGRDYPKFGELWLRSAIMMDGLVQAGELDPDRPTMITFFFRDGKRTYVYLSRRRTMVSLQ